MDRIIREIARRKLGIQTLRVRNRDSLDFRDLHVGGIREALAEAYKAGARSRTKASRAARKAATTRKAAATAQA